MSCLISVNSPFILYSCTFMFSFLFFQAVFRLTPPSSTLGGRNSSTRRPRLVGSRQAKPSLSGRPGSGVRKPPPGQQGKGVRERRVRGGLSPRRSRLQFGIPFLRPPYPPFPPGMTPRVRKR